jgi:hypothetical protein
MTMNMHRLLFLLMGVAALNCAPVGYAKADVLGPAPLQANGNPNISLITVCNNQYAHPHYTCGHFATDFLKQATEQHIRSWIVVYGISGIHSVTINNKQESCSGGHAVNIVNTDTIGAAAGNSRYCAVEPQNSNTYQCWTQGSSTPVVASTVKATLMDLWPVLKECYKTYPNNAYFVLNPSSITNGTNILHPVYPIY